MAYLSISTLSLTLIFAIESFLCYMYYREETIIIEIFEFQNYDINFNFVKINIVCSNVIVIKWRPWWKIQGRHLLRNMCVKKLVNFWYHLIVLPSLVLLHQFNFSSRYYCANVWHVGLHLGHQVNCIIHFNLLFKLVIFSKF